MSFKDTFARTPPGPERERLVYQEAISDGKPTDLVPLTVDGPQNSKVTYYITRDFLRSSDGQYLTMSPTTAQMIANAFHMYLPTNTVSDQVWKAAKAAGTAVNVPPLSGTGYRGSNGQWYSAQDVVANRIGATDAAVEFSNRVNSAISSNPNAQTGLVDIGGGGKWLTMPPADGSVGLHGIRQGDNTVQGGYGTIHKGPEEIATHTEYGTYLRLLDNKVEVKTSDGRTQQFSLEEFAKSPYASAMFMNGQDIRNGQLASYDVSHDKAGLASITPGERQPREEVAERGPGGMDPEQINQFLDSLMKEIASTRNGMKKFAVIGDDTSTLDPDSIISPEQYGFQPGVPPPGYTALNAGPSGRAPRPVEDMAKQVLNMFCPGGKQCASPKYPHGTMIPFTVNGRQYMARAEQHSNSNYGISVYESTGGNGAQARMKLLQRVQDAPDDKENEVETFLKEFEQEL